MYGAIATVSPAIKTIGQDTVVKSAPPSLCWAKVINQIIAILSSLKAALLMATSKSLAVITSAMTENTELDPISTSSVYTVVPGTCVTKLIFRGSTLA